MNLERPYTCIYGNRFPTSNYKTVICFARSPACSPLIDSVQPDLDSGECPTDQDRSATTIIDKHRSAIHSLTGGVAVVDRIVGAVGKQIIANQTITCGSVLVRIDKPGDHRVIVPALQIVEARLGIVIIPTVPQRIDVRQATAGGYELALGIVLIGGHRVAIDILNAGNVALLSGM